MISLVLWDPMANLHFLATSSLLFNSAAVSGASKMIASSLSIDHGTVYVYYFSLQLAELLPFFMVGSNPITT